MSAVLLLVLAQDPPAESAASAIAASAADGLDGRVHVELERVTTMPADDEAVHRGVAVKAGAVIEVSWPDADGMRAHLHAHLRPTAAWVDRDVTFEPTSSPWERGRAVGLAIAAMLPDEEAPAPTTVVPPVAVAPPAAPVVDRPVIVTPRPETKSAFDASLSFEVATGITTGGRGAFTWWLHPRVGVHVDVGGRASTVRAANARVIRFDAGAGGAIRVFGTEAPGSTTLTMYAEVRAAHDEVERTRLDGVEESHGRFLPVAAFSGELGLPAVGHVDLVLACGADLSLGKTTLAINGPAVTDVPRFAVGGAIGLRWTF